MIKVKPASPNFAQTANFFFKVLETEIRDTKIIKVLSPTLNAFKFHRKKSDAEKKYSPETKKEEK